MKLTIYFIIILSFSSLSFVSKKCEITGVYKVVYEKQLDDLLITKIEFHDSVYYRTFELGKVKGNISKVKDRNGKCIFYLKDILKKADPIKVSQVSTTNSNEDKIISDLVMEITEPFGDTINFKVVRSNQLNVISNKGKLIKQ